MELANRFAVGAEIRDMVEDATLTVHIYFDYLPERLIQDKLQKGVLLCFELFFCQDL